MREDREALGRAEDLFDDINSKLRSQSCRVKGDGIHWNISELSSGGIQV